jgi:hypothetical protein
MKEEEEDVMDSVEESEEADDAYEEPQAGQSSSSKVDQPPKAKAQSASSAVSAMPPTPSIGQLLASAGDLEVKARGKYISAQGFELIYEEFKSQHYHTNVLRDYKPRSAEVYGEALPVFIEYLIKRLNIKDTLYDIGSGIGNVVVQIAARTGCKAIGVEVRADLHDIAINLSEHVQNRLAEAGKSCGDITLVKGDATAESGEVVQFIAESTIIFMNNVCYPAAMQQKLENLFESSCSHGTRIVAMKHMFPRGDVTTKRMRKGVMAVLKQPWTKVATPKDMFSWTSNSLTFYVYEVDRSMTNYSFFVEDYDSRQQQRRNKTPLPSKKMGRSEDNPVAKKKKKKGPPEGERRFRKPKKSTPREPLTETHLLVSSYLLPTKDGNQVLDKYLKYEPEGRFYHDDRSMDEKILAEGRLSKFKLPVGGRWNLSHHDHQGVAEHNMMFLSNFTSASAKIQPVTGLPLDPKERILSFDSRAMLLSRPSTVGDLPDVPPYVPWTLPARELPPTRLISIDLMNTGLNLQASGETTKEKPADVKPDPLQPASDAMQVDSEEAKLVAGPCKFETRDWSLPCLNHTELDAVLPQARKMFDSDANYYSRCIHSWMNRNDGQRRMEFYNQLRDSFLKSLNSTNVNVRHLLGSVVTRLPEEALLELLRDIPKESWKKQFTQNNSVVLSAILHRLHSGLATHNFAMHRAVIVTAISSMFLEIISKPQATRNVLSLWQLCVGRTERQPLLAPILANLVNIISDSDTRYVLLSMNPLETGDREEISEICHAIAVEAEELLNSDEDILKIVMSLFTSPENKQSRKLAAEIALDQFASFIPTWFMNFRVGLVYYLLETAESEPAASIVAIALLQFGNLTEVLNYGDNAGVVIKLVLPFLKPDMHQQLKSLLVGCIPSLNAQARYFLADLLPKPAAQVAAAKKKRGRESDAQSDTAKAGDATISKKTKLE